MTATYTKLRYGAWGVRISGTLPKVGDRVNVTKRSGETKTETISAVVWSGNGITLAAIEASPRPSKASPRPNTRRRGGCSCDCDDCARGCRCDAHCVCRGGNVCDC